MQSPLRFALIFAMLGLAAASPVQAQSSAPDYFRWAADLQKLGKHRDAIPYLSRAVEIDSRYEPAYVNRGWAWTVLGEYDKAIIDLDYAMWLDPNDASAHNNRGWTRIQKGEYRRAVADLDQALRLNPQFSLAYINRSVARINLGQYDEALADCNRVLEISPDSAAPYCSRGCIWQHKGQYGKALADYRKAVAIKRDFADAYNCLAAIQATCPDARYRNGPEAFQNAKQAFLLSGGNSFIYTCTLAEAYAENGDFPQARQWMEKAIAMAAATRQVRDVDNIEMQTALALFKQDKPYHESAPTGDVDPHSR
jgi:tetratricopeptide (TPR) repeat protein